MSLRTASALAEGASEIVPLVKRLGQQLGDAPSLVMFFASSGYVLGDIIDPIKRIYPDALVLGSSTAGEFTEQGDAKNSVALFAIAGDLEVRGSMAFHLQQDVERAVASATSGMPRAMEGYPFKTALLFLDPFAGRSDEATLLASEYLGQDVTIAGGASGDDLKMVETNLSLNHLVATNALALVVLYTKTPVGLGVSHGHRVMSGPMRVTRASGSTVYELDGRPAWDVWVDETRGHPLAHLDPEQMARDELTRFLLTYEAGLGNGDMMRLRAPFKRERNGALGFACGIPVGTEIRITESSPDAQVASAVEAARRAKQALKGTRVSGALVFDCICRALILGNRFDEAVRRISDELGQVPLAGFETYGEIGAKGFHNTSTVVLAFGATP